MTERAKKPASYEDLLALPEHVVGEILGGELKVSPRPAGPHALAERVLGVLLGPFDVLRNGPGGWWIYSEPELHLGEDVLVPDLAGWRRVRMPSRFRGPFVSLAPDWICEIASPSTAGIDRALKLPIYGREQVGHAWIIDPLARTLEVYRWEQDRWCVLANFTGDAPVRAAPFEAIELDLGALWLPPLSPWSAPPSDSQASH